MIDIQAYREHMPHEIHIWGEHLGLDVISRETILHQLEISQIENEGASEIELLQFKGLEMRALANLYPGGGQLKPTLRRAEAAIKAGVETKLGRELMVSPFRWSATIQSLLATKCRRVIP